MPRVREPSSPNRANVREVLAVNIIRLRAAKGWSQEALAFECGLHRTFIAHVERKSRNLSLDNIDKIAAAFSVETWQLLKPTYSA